MPTEQGETKLISHEILKGVKHEERRALRFWDELPPLGFKVYRLHRGGNPSPSKSHGVEVKENVLENEHYRVIVEEDGTFVLVDKALDLVLPGLHVSEDEGDAGDEYNFSPPSEQTLFSSCKLSGKIQPLSTSPWKGAIRV